MSSAGNKIDAAISEILRDVPRRALEKLLKDKLQKAGVKASKASIAGAAAKILAGQEGEVSLGGKADDGIKIELTDEDVRVLTERMNKFANVEFPKILLAASDRAATDLHKSLVEKWAREHRRQLKDLAGFRKNLEKRYGSGLNKLRMLMTIAREWGQENYQRKFQKSHGNLSALDDVSIRLHVRACQVALEIITLLETGLADGAMARWRTLHEIATTALFIEKHGADAAERYIQFQIVESKKALTAYNDCSEELGYRPTSKKQAAKIAKDYARVISQYGKPFGGEYGWAAQLVGKGADKKVTFAALQDAVGMKDMRSHYKMASYNVHASPKGVYFKLGQMEQTATTLLAGSSNAGLVEPAQNAALSLAKLTMIVCNDKEAPAFENNVFLKVVNRLMWEIPRAFAKADTRLKRDHKRFSAFV